MIDSKPLSVTILNSESLVATQMATSVTSYNHLGIFDILPRHENFISIIQKQIIIHGVDGKDTAYDINKGVLKVSDDKVDIYLDTVTKTATY